MDGKIAVAESGLETPGTTGAFNLIPRIAGVDGRGARDFLSGLFLVVAGGIFVAFLGVSDRMNQRDQRGDSYDCDSDDNVGGDAHGGRG